jgi:hypothetical protein
MHVIRISMDPRGLVKKVIALILLIALMPLNVLGWGIKGHAIVADIAYSRLTSQTKKNIRAILGDDHLAAIASWPDQIKKQRDESYDWHFVDIPKDAPGFDDARDCFRPQDKHKDAQTDHQNCAVDRIEFFKKVLADENATQLQRVEAIKWIVHFVADLHQPLHAIDEARGGNDIKLPVFGSPQCGDYPCNLHWTWDNMLLEHTGRTEPEYVHYLQKLIQSEHLDQRPIGTPIDWANESHVFARDIMNASPVAVDEAYYQANIHLVDERLALAGLRLASVLNSALGHVKNDQLKQDLRQHQGS